ncbi:MAG: adenylate/guanylate cyclase domain-containing protein [Candidatus Promineifilaceae bacterium]|nr:adenylate/guanylate cyclase domain-containing protein [Candidatus Promineifilaceae bacterium]
MICPKCQTSNVEDANFCLNCGQRIARLCFRCGRRVLAHARFCDSCGQALVGSSEGTARAPDQPAQAVDRPAATPPAAGRAAPDETTVPTALAEEAQQAEPPTSSDPISPAQDERAQTADEPAAPAAAAPPAGEPAPERSGPADSPLDQYIPRALMKKLEAARTSGDMVGERRVVTMLFCDVKGSTAAAELLDPEEWSEIINGAFEHMIRPVYTYEGTVARLMGDGILAFFGAPLAHEDDPQRAVLAGLDIVSGMVPYREQIKQEWGIDFDVRVGINTGLVVVGAVGSDLRMEYTALGDAINLAARMEQTAEPGTVQIAYDTYKLVKPLFKFEKLGGVEVKGKEKQVQAYRVLERKVAGGRVRGIEGLHAEMVGRDVELRTMRSLVNDVKQGVGRIVCVLGEAGLGKSRLISETRQFFDQLPGPESDWYETTSLSYESNQAYGLFQRLIRRVSGIGYDDAPRMMQKKLSALADSLPEGRRERAGQLFDALFGLNSSNGAQPLEGETFKRELFEVVQAWWRSYFSKRPTVLVFDDMHWADAASIELLRELLPLTGEIGLVLICAFRAERRAPAWQIKRIADDEYRHRYTEVSLRPLSESESNELVNRLLATPEIPDNLRANILSKSDGNPFFIEEVVRSLIESGVVVAEERTVDGQTKQFWVATSDSANFSIPDNLQSLLAARMDRLEEATRATLQLASVIGRSFYLRVLQAVDESSPELDKHVGTLLRLDLIRESARVPEVEYSFRNPLTQEAVYETILLKRRREFHRRVGEVMEELYPERLEGLFGLLAHHFTLAGEHQKAVGHYRQAARQALTVYAHEEADQNLHAALQLLDAEPKTDSHLILFEEIGDVCRLVRDFSTSISYYQLALEAWNELEDHTHLAAMRLHRKIVEIATETKWSVDSRTYEQIGAISHDSRTSLQAYMQEMAGEEAHPETVRSLVALSVDAWRVQTPADWESAQKHAQTAVSMAEQLDGAVLLSRALGALASVLDGRSKLRDHVEVARRRLDVSQAETFEDVRERVDARRGIGVALMYVGEYQEALPYLEEATELAGEIRAMDQVANALGIRAQCLFRMDRWDDVLAIEHQWRDLEEQYSRERVGETCFFVALSGSVHALRGDYERAEAYAQESYDYMVSMSGLPEHWQRNQFY